MTTYGLILIVVALGCVVLMFWRMLELQAQRDAAQAYVAQVRSELEDARMQRELRVVVGGGAQ